MFEDGISGKSSLVPFIPVWPVFILKSKERVETFLLYKVLESLVQHITSISKSRLYSVLIKKSN
jgi:hypothetical protein